MSEHTEVTATFKDRYVLVAIVTDYVTVKCKDCRAPISIDSLARAVEWAVEHDAEHAQKELRPAVIMGWHRKSTGSKISWYEAQGTPDAMIAWGWEPMT